MLPKTKWTDSATLTLARVQTETAPATEATKAAGGNTDKILFWDPQYLHEYNRHVAVVWGVWWRKQLCMCNRRIASR